MRMEKRNAGSQKSATILFGAMLGWSVFVADAAEPPRSVAVSGTCLRNVIPDRGAVTVTAESRDADAKRAQVAANRSYEAVRSKVARLSLPDGDLSTAEYLSEEIREWEKDRLVSKGYRTRISLRVETSDHSRLGEVIDIASREGIKQMSGLQLFVSSKKMLTEKMACLKEAAEQARAKADSLAKSLGAKLGEVLTIQENASVSPEPPMPMMRGAMAMDAVMEKSAPRIEPGKTELSTLVQVSFELK
jgi:uncharacterized protein YggE